MPTKKHQDKLRILQERYEKSGFVCKRNYPLFDPVEQNFALIDLVCFRDSISRAFEIEESGKQVLKNARDLQRFKAIFKGSKVCQMTPSDTTDSCTDFKNKIRK